MAISVKIVGEYIDISNNDLTSVVAFGIFGVCALVFSYTKSPKIFRVALAVKFVFYFLFLLTLDKPANRDFVLASIFIFEIILYETFGLNIAFGAVVAVLSILIPVLASGNPANFEPWGLVLLSLVVFVAANIVYYRERYIELQERMWQMDRIVSRLGAASLGYRQYAEEAESRSQEEERLRITRDLHDIVGYTFTNNIMMMEAAYTKIHKEPARVSQLIALARENATTGLEMIRKSLYALRENKPHRPSSMSRFNRIIELFKVATQVKVHAEYVGLTRELPVQIEDFFYFFIQEGLTNAFIHGGATEVTVRLICHARGHIAVIHDNGTGASVINEGIGMSGMRERLAALGGTFIIENNVLGFMVQCEIPVSAAVEDRIV